MSTNSNKIISLQELINAQVDAHKLELIMNEAPWVEVTTRLGRKCYSIATIQGIIDQYKLLADQELDNLRNAIEIAAATGAGANGWTDKLIQTWSGRTQEERNKDFVTTHDYGSLGDGSGRRLSAVYTNLAEAQVKYPNARSLDDTIDLVSIEKALINNNYVKLPKGNYVINRSIPIPSYTTFEGDGWASKVTCTSDMERWAHMIVNSEGDYTIGYKSDADVKLLMDANKGNANIVIKNMWLRGDLDTRIQMTRSCICLKFVDTALIQGVRTSWAGYHGIDIADASEGHISDMPEYLQVWEEKPSSNVTIDNCFIEYHGDDGITTHYSTDITIKNIFIKYGAFLFGGSNGLEIDDGSRNVFIDNITVINELAGIVVKSHDNCPTPYNVTISNCRTYFCGYGYHFYSWQSNNTDGNYEDLANNIQVSNCTAVKSRRFSSNAGREPYALYISNYSGVNIQNFAVIGELATHMKDVDVSDFQPFYKKADGTQAIVSESMMPYDTVVMQDGVDVTYKTEKTINITTNCRNITLDGVYIYKAVADNGLIRVQTSSSYNTIISSLTAKDCIGNVISISVDTKSVKLSNISAESSDDANINNYVVTTGGATPMWATNSAIGLSQKGYAGLYKFYQTVYADYTNLQKSTRFVALNTDTVPPLSVTSSSTTAKLASFGNFDIEVAFITTTSNSFRHLTKSGYAQWFGQTDGINETPMCGVHGGGNFIPYTTNLYSLGHGPNLWSAVYAQNGVIQTSDERLKQQFRSLNDREKDAALEIKNSICMFKFNDAVDLKGDGARWHCGVKAQQVIEIMQKHELDWQSCGFVCYDEWEATDEQEAGSRYAIRYDELAMFVLANL